MMRRAGIFMVFLVALCGPLRAQMLPLGQWQSHFDYRSVHQVIQAGSRIYCASYNGLFSVDIQSGEIRTLSKSDGLSSNGVSSMGYLPESKLLLLAYRNGLIDFVFLDDKSQPDEIQPWNLLNETPGLPADKAIRSIIFKDKLAYLATGFGILVLDTQLRQVEETYRYIGPNGAQVAASALAFAGDSLFVNTAGGLIATSMRPDVNRQYFANWKPIQSPGMANSVAVFNQNMHAAIPGKGIYQYQNGKWSPVFASISNSLRMLDADENALTITTGNALLSLDRSYKPLLFNSPLFSDIRSGIQTGSQVFWVGDQKNGLLTNQNTAFRSVSPEQADTTISPRPDSVVKDRNGLSWTRLQENLGGGMLVRSADGSRQKVLSTSIGNGGLPSSTINSLAVDQDGYVWFASAKGAGYFVPDGVLEASRVDAVLPVYGQRRLFNNEECTAIAVESGNRKWIATRTGLYQFNADGTELIRKFTAADSPLPSDQITALRFEAETGLLFIDTPAGMVSYQTDAKAPAENLSSIKLFPNPVRPGYSGNVGISGLTAESTVKITDLAGRLVFETRSQGGLAAWNLNDYTGRRARAGIYMVFVVSADGAEHQAGKLAIIN